MTKLFAFQVGRDIAVLTISNRPRLFRTFSHVERQGEVTDPDQLELVTINAQPLKGNVSPDMAGAIAGVVQLALDDATNPRAVRIPRLEGL